MRDKVRQEPRNGLYVAPYTIAIVSLSKRLPVAKPLRQQQVLNVKMQRSFLNGESMNLFKHCSLQTAAL